MSSAFRLRIELPDQPGALAKVAAVIAERGGNVLSVDIHELDGGQAVDEIVAEFPDAPGDLASALDAVGAGTLLSSTPETKRVDPVVWALRWARLVVEAGNPDGELELSRAIAEICPATATWVCSIDVAQGVTAGRLALERGGPVVHLERDVPAPLAKALPDAAWLLAIADSHLNPRFVAFVGRPASLRFAASEVARVEALVALSASLSGSFAA